MGTDIPCSVKLKSMRIFLTFLMVSVLSGMEIAGGQSGGLVKLREFVEAINSHDQARVEALVRSSFKSRPGGDAAISARAKRFLDLAKEGAPLSVGNVLKDEATVVIVEIKNAHGQDYEMKMSFDSESPFLATSVYMGDPGSQTVPPPKQYPVWNDLDDLITQIKADTNVPALSIAFSKGKITQSAVVGEREIHKPDKARLGDTWLLGSITKSMTATMIARLIDKGVIHWDTTIEQALPNTPMRPEYRKVTLLQLLQHRSGVQQDRLVTSEFLDQAAGESKNIVEVREHYTRFTLARSPLAKPGVRMEYSNAGYSIAAHMAEVLAKKPYEQLMQELVFNPLGMKSAKIGVPGTPGHPGAPGELNGHVFEGKELVPHVIDEPKLNGIQAAAGAGVSMTVEDLLKFAKYHLAGLQGHVTLMSSKNFAVLHTPAETGVGVEKYACGWVIDDTTTSQTFHGHNGSDGTFFAEIAIWPTQNLAAVAISNAANRQSQSAPFQAILAVYNRYGK